VSRPADATPWRVGHLHLHDGRFEIEPGPTPALVIFWWRSLPLGMQRFLDGELPLARDIAIAWAGPWLARQAAAREPLLGGPLSAGSDGQVRLQVCDAWRAFDDPQAMDRLAAPALEATGALSVIVCTRDRPQALAACLRALAAQAGRPHEVIVVDNAADGSARAACAGLPGVRYLHEPRPGLSIARNAGLSACRSEFAAFTDDDVVAHPQWTRELMRAFGHAAKPDVVTGLVLPAELRTAAQRRFQFDLGGFGENFVPLLYDQRFFAEAMPYGAQVWRIGAGANMAFRRDVFERAGFFDERLGAGAAGCSEDSELWYRVLAGGGTCLYEPRAVVMHHHREDDAVLHEQQRAYMRGHVAALYVQYRRHGHRGNLRRVWRQLPRHFASVAARSLRAGAWSRLRLLGAEVAGWAEGLRLGWTLKPEPKASSPP
jgi:GT2 family glycosyltransferase